MLPKKILVLRFSAMGDVVLLVPVLTSLMKEYPETRITVVTRPKFAAFFNNIEGVSVFSADVDTQYKGWGGLWRLFRTLKKERFELVMDLHDHLRTKILRTFFFLAGVPLKVFDKGRGEKKKFVRAKNKVTSTLLHTTERYRKAFEDAGLQFPLLNGPHLYSSPIIRQQVRDWLSEKNLVKKEKWIGVAPFAMHRSKIWPVENYKTLFEQLLREQPYRFFLFGGGKKEIEFFQWLKNEFPENVTLVAGVLNLEQELAFMQQLDLMLCVDSSNMHLATLVGAPILSIWGGTHPGVGFGPLQRDERSIIQISTDELPCRPCSVYGKETCHRGDFACITKITAEALTFRITNILTVGNSSLIGNH